MWTRTSFVWNFFKTSEDHPEKAQCLYCKKTYRDNSHAAMKQHITDFHNTEYVSFMDRKKREALEDDHPTQTRYEGQQLRPGASGNSSRQDETSNSENSYKRISKLIVRMIVLQNLPCTFVDGGGFRDLLKDLAPKYNLEKSEVFKTYMVDIYDQMKIKVKREIIKFPNLSITAHIRKDCKSNKFVILLVSHGITETFKRSSILLKCSIIDNITTEDEVGKMINTIAYELDFPIERVHCMIRDESSSSQRGTQSVLLMQDLDCAVHKIQNIIRETFLSQENVTNIPTNITNNFPNALNELEKILNKLNVNETGFVDIIKKFCFIFTIGTTVVVKYGNFDTHLENQMEQSAYNVVKLLLDFINCERSQQNLSSVIPTFKQITESLEEYLNVSPESNAIKAAVSSLKTGFETALSSLENNKLYAIATFLDPHYKNHFSREVKIKICRDLSTMTNVQSTESHRTVDSFEVVPPKRTCIRLNDLVNDTFKIKESDNTSDLRKEINDYGNIGALNVDEDPLEWWKNNGEQFKSLSKFARRFLSPPAVSVISEQLFEGDGSLELTLNKEEDAKLLFVKHNAEMFGFDF
ncbi:zinc finger BED domain-containing protein 4-like isoform X2 [Spodoptera litura]|uniref:Zinc finger BED domain-containing protein 4-like isoform X2 n=1 Tax=Spodoptera litura TaxID=69820 RepID=A0A9J7ITQ9_SPOLT|nr:zinc finger BED domain-containing protein 4-like isoform X2 [Spodoptera litura]